MWFVGGPSSYGSGKGKNHVGNINFGFDLVKGKANHPMEDYHVARFVELEEHELGLFAIYDGHSRDRVPSYLQKHLFDNILNEVWQIRITIFIHLKQHLSHLISKWHR